MQQHARAVGAARRRASRARRRRTRGCTRPTPSPPAACPACARARSPTPSSRASAAPRMNPRASAATTKSTASGRAQSASAAHGRVQRPRVEQQRRDVLEDDARLREVRDVADELREVHFAIRRRSRTSSRCLRCDATAARFSSASTASLRRSGLRERSAGARICCSSARLALGRALEHAQVAPGDAVRAQLLDRAHDLAVGLVVVARPAAQLALDDPEVLELLHQPRLGAGLLDDVLERVQRAAVADRDTSAAAAPRRAGRRASAPPAPRPTARRPTGPRRAPGGSRPAAGTRRAAAAGSSAAARRRWTSRAGSRRACAAASAASGPRGSGSSRSRCPGTPAGAPCRRPRWSATWPVSALPAGVSLDLGGGVVGHGHLSAPGR